MSTDITVLGLGVDTSQIKAATTSLDALSRAGNQAQTSATGMESGFNRLRNVMAGLALGMTAIELVKMADNMSLVDARLKLATGNTADFGKAQEAVYKIAQMAGVGIAEVAELYTKLHDPVKKLGGTTKETEAIVTAFSASLRIGGASATAASSATLQFAQAMASGKLQGDEFRSMSEASPRFMQALADGIGVPTAELKKMGTEGKLTAEVVGNALMSSLGQLKAEMATMPVTVGVAMQRLKNDFSVAINDINKATGTTVGIASMIEAGRALIPTFKAEMISALTTIGSWISSNKDEFEDIWTVIVGLAKDVYGIATAVGSVIAATVDWAVKSGAVRVVFETMRLLVAGFKDGITLIGVALATLGSELLQFLVSPLVKVAEIAGAIASVFSDDMGAALKQTAKDYLDWATAGEKAAKGIFDSYANGGSAVQQLGIEMAKTDAATKQLRDAVASSSVTTAAHSNEMERMRDRADAAGGQLTTLKGKHTELSAEQDKAKKAYDDFMVSIEKHITEANKENEEVGKLNAAQKARSDWMVDLDGKYKTLTPSQLASMEAAIGEWEAALNVKAAKDELKKTSDELKRANEEYERGLQKELASSQDLIEKMTEQNSTIGLTEEAVTRLKAAKFLKMAADAEEEAGYIRLTDAASPYATKLDQIAANYRTMAGLVTDESYLQGLQKQREEWTKTAESWGSGLADALMGGWDSFKNYLKQQLVNFFIRIPLQGVMTSIVGGIGSMFGMPALAGQGAGGNILSSLGSMGSTMGNFGSLLGEGIGGVQSLLGFGGTGIVAGMGGIGAASVGGTIMTPAAMEAMIGTAGYGTSAAAGAAASGGGLLGTLGSVAPYLAGAYMIYSAFKHNPTPHLGGYAAFDASGVPNTTYGAGESNRSPELDRMVSSMLQPVYASLNSLASTFDPTGHRFGVAGTFKAEEAAEDGAWGVVQISHGGSTIFKRADGTLAADAEEGFGQYTQLMATSMREAIDLLDLPTWAADTLAAIGDSPSLDKLIETVNAISATVAGVNMMTEALEPLGGLFTKIAGLSQEAKIELAGMVGGIDALVQKSQSFVANYYSDEEQASIQARSILEAAQKAGVDSATFDKIAGLTSRGSLRALGDTIDLSAQGGNGVPSGLELAALLLNIQGTFANLTGEKGFLETSGMTLGELAGKSINPTILDVLAAATAAAAAGGDATTVTDAADTGDAASGDAATDATSADIVQINPAVLEAVADNTEYAVSLLTEIRDSIAASVKASSEVTVTAMQILVSVDSHLEKLEDMTYMAALAPATN